jgi:hypothetical protein
VPSITNILEQITEYSHSVIVHLPIATTLAPRDTLLMVAPEHQETAQQISGKLGGLPNFLGNRSLVIVRNQDGSSTVIFIFGDEKDLGEYEQQFRELQEKRKLFEYMILMKENVGEKPPVFSHFKLSTRQK